MIPELKAAFNYDSVMDLYSFRKLKGKPVGESVFNKNVIRFKKGDFGFTIDPLFDFSLGSEKLSGENTWTNTRGILVEGYVGENFAFSTRFYENQALFPGYIQHYINTRYVVPGQGDARAFGEAVDYSSASGYISYTPGRHFNFQLGHGKNFFGDGYRSLMLSDHAIYYPYFRINSSIWRFKYVNMWAQFNQPDNGIDPGMNTYPVKYGAFHYLSFKGGKNWNLSLFESVIWQAIDSTGYRGFDFNYLNPMVFYRPVEHTLSSPDNVFMGVNLAISAHEWFNFYTQFVIDEFRFSELKAGNGWMGNKYAWQTGFKSFNLFGIPKLFLQGEYNMVRPYMYAHYLTTQSYSHYYEPLAYSFGANTFEYLILAKYNFKRLFINAKYNSATFGLDQGSENYGKNFFLNYRDYANEYGNYIGQGLTTSLQQLDASLSFLVNPATNMNIYVGYTWREESNAVETNTYSWISFGFRTSLRNLYYDFY